jgi:hypothetical protein
MIPAPPRISAPPRPAPSPASEVHRPQLAPRLTTQTLPPFRHATRDSPNGSTPRSRPASPHPPPVPRPRCLRFPALCPPRSAARLPPAPFHPRLFARSYARLLSCVVDYACASRSAPCLPQPLTPQPDGYLSLEQFNECGSLPHRFGRAPHSLKVSSRGGVAAGVSGGREDDAAGDTGQGSGLVLGGTRRSASCRARRRMGWSATLKTRHAAPSLGREIPPVRRKLPNGTMGGLARV